jgi:3-oxoacyl-[acyl-carrier-protein] synthase II
MSADVFVTGMGIISSIGTNAEETLISLKQKQTGIGKLKYLQTIHDLPCGEIKLSDQQLKDKLNIKEDDVYTRTVLMGIHATKEALHQARLTLDGKYRVAFINGTTVGGMEKSEEYYLDFLKNDIHNEFIEAHDCGSCTERIADYFGGFSYVSTPSTACSSAANAIMLGSSLIEAGVVDIAVVGGSECITKFHLNGFNTLMILDEYPCRPFDQTRAGLNLGEGAAFVVLEASKTMKEREIEPLCKLSGYGNACDAYHQTASSPEGKGAVLAMQKALMNSRLNASDIDYINAHGTGTPNNDESEGNAIVSVFSSKIPYVSSTKSYTGHTTSAAGGVEAVISILALNNKFIPPNLNFSKQMESLSFAPVSDLIEGIEIQHVLSNSFGFGGNNSTLVFSKV